jgi:hypothetical protein
MTTFSQIAVPLHRDTPCVLSCLKERGRYGRRRLIAEDAQGEFLLAEIYSWSTWSGHCNGILLLDNFLDRAEARMERRSATL